MTALQSVSKLSPPLSPAHPAISPFYSNASVFLSHRAPLFSPQGLALSAWSFANARVLCPSAFSTLLEVLTKHAKVQTVPQNKKFAKKLGTESKFKNFNPQNLANIAWAFSRFFAGSSPRSESLDAQPSQTETSQHLPHHSIPPSKRILFFQELELACTLRAPKLPPPALSTIAWSFASCSQSAPKLFALYASLASPVLAQFPPQSLAILLWSFAHARIPTPGLFAAAAKLIAENKDFLTQCTYRDLANLVHAFGVSAPELACGPAGAALERQILLQMKSMNAHEISTVLHMQAKLPRRPSLELLSQACPLVVERASEFSSMGLSRVAGAYARTGCGAGLSADDYSRVFRALVFAASQSRSFLGVLGNCFCVS